MADKQILARILKYAVREFEDLSIDEIMDNIGADIEIGIQPVDPGLSKLGQIRGLATEDNVPGEGKIVYDIRFSAYHNRTEMKFLLNVEAQKSSDPARLGYHLENRITYYLARMLSAQKQTEFYHSDYDSIKKVRSIWICMDGSRDGDSIEEISLERRSVFGKREGGYPVDLMRAVVIHIRNRGDAAESENRLIAMLETLLTPMDINEKKSRLTERYGMVMSAEMEGRMQTMCNLSENILERGLEKGMQEGLEKGMQEGIEKGMQEGIEKGMQEGIEKERMDAVRRMIRAEATKEQILSFGYSEEEYRRAKEAL